MARWPTTVRLRGLIDPPQDEYLRPIVQTLVVIEDKAIVRLACGHHDTVMLTRVSNPTPVRCKSCENRSPYHLPGYRHPLIERF
jgi:hypothetical protein